MGSVGVSKVGSDVVMDVADDTPILVFVIISLRNGVVPRTSNAHTIRSIKDIVSHRVACVDRGIGVVFHLGKIEVNFIFLSLVADLPSANRFCARKKT